MNIQTSSQPAGRKTSFNYGYIVVIASSLIVMMNVGMYLTMGVFFKPISIEMGWTRADTSLPILISTVITALATIVAGNLVDKFGPRKISMVVVLFTGAGYLLMSQLHNLWQFYLYFGLMIGIGACLMSPLLSLIPRWFTTRRTVMAGIISGGGGVGGLFLPLAANWLIVHYSWQRAYLILGLVYLAVVLIAVQFLRGSPPPVIAGPESIRAAKKEVTSEPVLAHPLKGVFQSLNFWMMMVMCLTFGFVANTINLHTVPHATDIGISSTSAAGLLSIMNGVSIFGCVVLGALGDKIGNRKMMVATFVIEGALLVGLAFISSLWMLNLTMVIYGLAFGSGLAQSAPLVAKLFGTRSLGLILGVIMLAQTVGSGLGTFVPGFIYDISKEYFWAFMACGILCLLAVIATLSLKLKPSAD